MLNRIFFRETIRFEANGAGGAGGAGAAGSGSQTGAGGSAGGTAGTSGTGTGGTGENGSGAAASPIDYDRIQQMLDGTLQAKERTALKKYFEQQGLTPEQAQQAIDDFKAHQAAKTPDTAALQTQLTQAQAVAQKVVIENAATMQAVQLGIDVKNIPYVLKLVDLSQVAGQDGKINEETLKAAINKVLEDVPALKKQENATAGFTQVDTTGAQTGAGSAQNNPQQVATKRWNRFN